MYKKGLTDPDNHNSLNTLLQPDNLKHESTWSLGSITTNTPSGVGGIPVELFKILNRAAVKFSAFNMSANLENSALVRGLSFHSNPQKRQCQRIFKLPYNCTHLTHWQSNAQNSPRQASTVREP